jgi:putative ABC transport system permease protein
MKRLTPATPASASRSGIWLEQLWKEIGFAGRMLRRAPGFTLAVFSTLALCIGPNTAVLAVLYSLVLKPLPFPGAEQLVVIPNVAEQSGGAVNQATLQQYLDFTAHADLFTSFALVESANSTIGEETAPVRTLGNQVNASFFSVFGLQPLLGRFFTSDEEAAGPDHVLVLTQTFWESHYKADPGVIGRVVRMGGEPFTIIGVVPRSLESLYLHTDFFKPYARLDFQLDPRQRYGGRATLIGRMKPGITREAGLAQLTGLEARFRTDVATPQIRAYLDSGHYRVGLVPLRNESTMAVQKSLWLLESGAVFVLLIGAVNAVNLLLARANARRSELAIRYALGAGRTALLRQLLAESLLLTLTAAVAGLAFAWGALQVINRFLPVVARSAPPVLLEPRVVGTILLISLGLGIVLGILPFALLWQTGLRIGDARTASSSRAIRALSSSLVVTQVGVALVLLVGAGLLIRSFANVIAVDPGFDAAHIVQARIALPHAYDEREDNVAVRQRILASMAEIPGVESVAVVSYFGVGPAESFRSIPFTVHGSAQSAGDQQPLAIIDPVSSDFFITMNVRLLEGRQFNAADEYQTFGPTANPGVIVDQAFAQRYFPGRSALGEEVAFGVGPFPDGFKWPRIVGVVARANLAGLEGRDGLPFIYTPLNQGASPGFNLLVRSARPAADLLAAMRAKLHAIDPVLPLYNAGLLQESLDSMLLGRRGIMLLLGVFSGLALLLAGLGLYSVLAYDVSQRTREIGIRGAIGASREQIIGLILRQGLWKSGLGLGVGLIGALILTRYMRTLLFDVAPFDPVSFLAVPLVLLAVAALASWLPARRAAKVDPIVALRCE